MNKETLNESIRAEKAMNEALKQDKLKKATITKKSSVAKAKIVAQNI
ncbi:MAG: hypothetical protein RIC06_17280 [Cyclobacteriaceae bacterium]